MDKANLRRRILAARAGLSEETLRTSAAATRELLLDQPWVQMAGLVACYWSIGTETRSKSSQRAPAISRQVSFQSRSTLPQAAVTVSPAR